MNSSLKVTETGGKFWLTMGTISFGNPIETREKAEETKSWLISAMPLLIKHCENQVLKKEHGKWVEKEKK